MNKAAESCKIVIDDDGRIAKLIAGKLEMEEANPENSAALGFLINGKMAGGILYTALKPGNEVWLSIYSDDKRWCTRRVLKIIFGIVFDLWGCRRVNALIDVDNQASLRLATGVGFRKEGKMRQYRANGRDVYVLGMLKNECKFFKTKEKNNV